MKNKIPIFLVYMMIYDKYNISINHSLHNPTVNQFFHGYVSTGNLVQRGQKST